jgi:hypothetical protein
MQPSSTFQSGRARPPPPPVPPKNIS